MSTLPADKDQSLMEDILEAIYAPTRLAPVNLKTAPCPEKILALASFIETRNDLVYDYASRKYFPESKWGKFWGKFKPADIAAFGAVLFTDDFVKSNPRAWRHSSGLVRVLGVQETVNGLTFTDRREEIFFKSTTCERSRKGAVAMLRRLAKTGECYWLESDDR